MIHIILVSIILIMFMGCVLVKCLERRPMKTIVRESDEEQEPYAWRAIEENYRQSWQDNRQIFEQQFTTIETAPLRHVSANVRRQLLESIAEAQSRLLWRVNESLSPALRTAISPLPHRYANFDNYYMVQVWEERTPQPPVHHRSVEEKVNWKKEGF